MSFSAIIRRVFSLFNILGCGQKLGFLLLLLSIDIFQNSYAQQSDSLVFIKELKYANPLEKDFFYRSSQEPQKASLLPSFLIYSDEDPQLFHRKVSEKIELNFQKLKAEHLETKPEEKAVKFIHAFVHKEFLTRYERSSDFNQIFEDGTFNCVTATALYAMILDKLNIPYTIQEKPEHVYLIAYPQTFKIRMETTVPGHSYMAFTPALENEYLKSLVVSKIITGEELKSPGREALFNKYFFTDIDINLKELAGLHYYNHGIYDLDHKNYESAINNFKKGHLLYPCSRTRFLLFISAAALCANSNYATLKDIDNYILLLKTRNNGNSEPGKNDFVNEFIQITDKQIITAGDTALYRKSYNAILPAVNDTALSNALSYQYNYAMAWTLISKGTTKGSEVYLKEAYKLQPKNINLQNIAGEYIRLKIVNMSDPDQILKFISNFSKSYPKLTEHPNVTGMRANCYLLNARKYFYSDNILKGEENLLTFEKVRSEFHDIELNENFAEEALQAAGGAYFRKGNYAKAREKFRKGLTLVPGSFKLKDSLEKIKNY